VDQLLTSQSGTKTSPTTHSLSILFSDNTTSFLNQTYYYFPSTFLS
jgi:hypothetical protein